MKIPISEYACLDLDAPTLPAREVVISGATRWAVWCRHCGDPASPYWQTGYNVARAGG